MNYSRQVIAGLIMMLSVIVSYAQKPVIAYTGAASNDLIRQLQHEQFPLKAFKSPIEAVSRLPKGSSLLILSDNYPEKVSHIDPELINMARKKNIRLYIEYAFSPSLSRWISNDSVKVAQLERGVVRHRLGERLAPMDLLGINDCHYLKASAADPMLILGKVAGFDRAAYGISDIETAPLLFRENNMLIATTKLTHFRTGRYGPAASWKALWEYIIGWMTHNEKEIVFKNWLTDLSPSFAAAQPLPKNARQESVNKGAAWFYKGRFLIDASWKDRWLQYQGDGTVPFGPPVSKNWKVGDGSLGILEGHASNIYADGSEQYRYWIRADVQAEVAFALAAAGELLRQPDYTVTSQRLGDFMLNGANFRSGPKANKDSAVYGLLGWSFTHPYIFYGDDNARSVLGLIGASAFSGSDQWDKEIVEIILANLRTSGQQGFRGERLEEHTVQRNGWQYYNNREYINPHPHFESWLWACYLWLYDKTKFEPLLEKAKTAIRITMEAYPDKWGWTNGIQQERARMILPLAWLVRIEDTPQHREWLDRVVNKLLENQDACGAIREELGGGNGMFGTTKSNKEYGLHEAPLIFKNGDPVADMLYTSNFAFFALNEAAHATGNKKYQTAVHKLSDFLTRIQVTSQKHPDLDGAWFRAFDYSRWDYWASNADAGWGAWSTLTGWIQSWIIATQVLVEEKQSYWTRTQKTTINKQMPAVLEIMYGEGQRQGR